MDSTVESAVGHNLISAFRDKNRYSQDVRTPIFSPDTTDSSQSVFVPAMILEQIETLSYQFNDISVGSSTKAKLLDSINSTANILERSDVKFTDEYNELRILDSAMSIVPAGSRVLTFSPRYRKYLVDKSCEITVVLYDSKIISRGKTLSLEAGEVPSAHDSFYISSTDKTLLDNLILVSFSRDDDLDGRWAPLQGKEYDLIIHEESSYGRTGQQYAKDFSYDRSFLEPAIKSLENLAQGGNIVVKLESYGYKVNADLAYFYKYLFRDISIVKTSSSNTCSQEYYLIGIGFAKSRYPPLTRNINAMFTKIQAEYYLSSFLNNLDKSDSSSVNFRTWLTRVNSDIGLSIIINMSHALIAGQDFLKGFQEYHSPYVLDHVSYRQAIGHDGRTTLQSIPPHVYDSNIVDESDIDKMTNTGQVTNLKVTLSYSHDKYPRVNTALFLALSLFVQKAINHPLMLTKFPKIGTRINQTIVNMDYIAEQKAKIGYSMRNWLSILYANGTLDELVDYSSNLTIEDQNTINLIGQFVMNLDLSKVFEFTPPGDQNEWKRFFVEYILITYKLMIMVRKNPEMPFLQNTEFKILPLKNLRYRISYCMAGVNGMLSYQNDPSAVGEYELINALTVTERDQIHESQQIIDLSQNREYVLRYVEHTCLPIYLSAGTSELAVPEIYFRYKPDVELYANVVNRHAPIWCSANPKDVEFGSAGNFDDFTTPDNNYFADDSPKLMIAFPPMDESIMQNTVEKCLDLIQSLEAKSIAIIVVYPTNLKGVVESAVEDNLNTALISSSETNSVYQPFNGLTQKMHLHLLCIKTGNSAFNF